MFYVLVGIGPNQVEVPCLIFSSRAAALDYVVGILGPPKASRGVQYWVLPDLDLDGNTDLAKKFFTEYYGGCGDCSAIELRPVKEGRPFVPFNLD